MCKVDNDKKKGQPLIERPRLFRNEAQENIPFAEAIRLEEDTTPIADAIPFGEATVQDITNELLNFRTYVITEEEAQEMANLVSNLWLRVTSISQPGNQIYRCDPPKDD